MSKKIVVRSSLISTNAMYQGRKRKSVAYRAWCNEFGWLLMDQIKKANPKIAPFRGWVSIQYDFFLKNFLKADVDNFVKATQDVLVNLKIIQDDRWVRQVIATKYPLKCPTGVPYEPGVVITIENSNDPIAWDGSLLYELLPKERG